MKKTVCWLTAAMIVLLIFPLIIRLGIRHSYNAKNLLLIVIVPLYFVILGISVGKSIKKHWFLPVVSLALFFVGDTYILSTKQYRDYETIVTLIIIYLVLSLTAMLLTAAILRIQDRKRVLKKAIITSCIASGIGFLINFFSYLIFKDFPLGITQWGGDYRGKSGFGLLLNQVYPMTVKGEHVPRNTVWLSFEPVSLVIPLAVFFVIALAGFLISAVLKNRKTK